MSDFWLNLKWAESFKSVRLIWHQVDFPHTIRIKTKRIFLGGDFAEEVLGDISIDNLKKKSTANTKEDEQNSWVCQLEPRYQYSFQASVLDQEKKLRSVSDELRVEISESASKEGISNLRDGAWFGSSFSSIPEIDLIKKWLEEQITRFCQIVKQPVSTIEKLLNRMLDNFNRWMAEIAKMENILIELIDKFHAFLEMPAYYIRHTLDKVK